RPPQAAISRPKESAATAHASQAGEPRHTARLVATMAMEWPVLHRARRGWRSRFAVVMALVRAPGPLGIIPSMRARRIGLVMPPPDGLPSGGDLYDAAILRQAASRGYPLQAVPWGDSARLAQRWDLL